MGVHVLTGITSTGSIISAALLLPLLGLLSSPSFCHAAIPCNTTSDCVAIFSSGRTTCIHGTCSNPFASGCLRVMAEREGIAKGDAFGGTTSSSHPASDLLSHQSRRVCNSDDHSNSHDNCRIPEFLYQEIRINNGNWESSMFLAWVLQILLSELLDVPATIETRQHEGDVVGESASFYDSNNGFAYAKSAYNYESLREASMVNGDCSKSSGGRPCAHLIPEAWNGEVQRWTEAQEEGYIELPEGNGAVGKTSFFIPAFTADRDWTLASFYGLRGENNRKKMAETFLRPTNWFDYCTLVSGNNCTTYDGVSKRRPVNEEERASYFVEGLYTGHFRATEKNNCTRNPTTCTGHIVDAPCTWTTYTEGQMYWNNISLTSDGPEKPNSGYQYSHMIQIWNAANHTRSNVIMWWWTPDATVEKFIGSPSAFQPVLFPEASEDCQVAREQRHSADRCSANRNTRLGEEAASCDYEAHSLQKLISAGLRASTYAVPEAHRSPALDFIKQVRIGDLALDSMLREWETVGIDKYGYDSREVVCKWVYTNVERLERFIPKGYPRNLHKKSLYSIGVIYGAIAVGGISLVLACGTSAVTYRWRKAKVVVYAQVQFLFWILVGFIFVAIGAIVEALEPTRSSCIVREWTVTLGYTLELVPLLIKVSALNRLMDASCQMKKLKINPRKLKVALVSVVLCVIVYLTIWTAVDPPTRQEDRVLDSKNERIVNVSTQCSSTATTWKAVAFVWEGLLLLCALALAFQSRGIKQEFNESQSLAFMTYSHFLFMVMRGVTYVLQYRGQIPPNIGAGAISFVLSFDTIFTLMIYFGPKFIAIMQPNESNVQVMSNRRRSTISASTSKALAKGNVNPHFGGSGQKAARHSSLALTDNTHGNSLTDGCGSTSVLDICNESSNVQVDRGA